MPSLWIEKGPKERHTWCWGIRRDGGQVLRRAWVDLALCDRYLESHAFFRRQVLCRKISRIITFKNNMFFMGDHTSSRRGNPVFFD